MAIEKVGILGCGLMGSGIAQVASGAGYEAFVRELDAELLDRGMASIERFLSRGVEKGKLSEARKKEILTRIHGTTRLEDLRDVDLAIEAIVEDLEAKKELFKSLDEIVNPNAIFATNTSSLCVTELASGTRRPDRFVGMHFFNPVPLMKLVELITLLSTTPEVRSSVTGFTRSLGKTPIQAPDRPGFVVNRLLIPYMLDAIRALEEGVGTQEDIDVGMKLGCGHPMGPFELIDFVGVDTTLYIANIMYDELKEKRFAPPPLLRRMVLEGRLGRKSGVGFYEYT